MKKKRTILFGILSIAISSCVTTVPVSTTDSVPPKIQLATAVDGNLVSSNGQAVREFVLRGSDVAFIVSGSDPSGIKRLSFNVLSGGKMHIGDDIKTDTLLENEVIDNTSNDLLALGGFLQFDSPFSEIHLQASTEDWAGNVASINNYVLVQVSGPEARISANRETINRGESVTLTYETENADAVFLNGVPLSTRNGTRIVSPQVSTDYILKSTSYVGESYDTVHITVIQPAPILPEIVQFSANKLTVNKNELFTVSWLCNDTELFSLEEFKPNGNSIGGSSRGGAGATQGSFDYRFNIVGEWTIKCTAKNEFGVKSKQIKINVIEPIPDPDPDPVPTCFRTNQIGTLFSFNRIQLYSGGSYWAFHNEINQTSGRIVSIKNNMNIPILLEVGANGNVFTIQPNATSTNANGMRSNSLYEVVIFHTPNNAPAYIDITVCYE